MVVTPTTEITPGDTVVVVAATTMFSRPLPSNQVELPWQHNTHPVTGLYKRCVAVCDWLVEINQDQIEDIAGITPPAILQRILSQLPSADTE